MHKQKSPKWDERYMEHTAAHILFAFAFLTQKKTITNKNRKTNPPRIESPAVVWNV